MSSNLWVRTLARNTQLKRNLEHQVEILYPIEGAKDAVIKDLEEQIQALESQMNALKGHIAEEAELNLQLARG